MAPRSGELFGQHYQLPSLQESSERDGSYAADVIVLCDDDDSDVTIQMIDSTQKFSSERVF